MLDSINSTRFSWANLIVTQLPNLNTSNVSKTSAYSSNKWLNPRTEKDIEFRCAHVCEILLTCKYTIEHVCYTTAEVFSIDPLHIIFHIAWAHTLESIWCFPYNILEASLVFKFPLGFVWLVLMINPCIVKVSNSLYCGVWLPAPHSFPLVHLSITQRINILLFPQGPGSECNGTECH